MRGQLSHAGPWPLLSDLESAHPRGTTKVYQQIYVLLRDDRWMAVDVLGNLWSPVCRPLESKRRHAGWGCCGFALCWIVEEFGNKSGLTRGPGFLSRCWLPSPLAPWFPFWVSCTNMARGIVSLFFPQLSPLEAAFRHAEKTQSHDLIWFSQRLHDIEVFIPVSQMRKRRPRERKWEVTQTASWEVHALTLSTPLHPRYSVTHSAAPPTHTSQCREPAAQHPLPACSPPSPGVSGPSPPARGLGLFSQGGDLPASRTV